MLEGDILNVPPVELGGESGRGDTLDLSLSQSPSNLR